LSSDVHDVETLKRTEGRKCHFLKHIFKDISFEQKKDGKLSFLVYACSSRWAIDKWRHFDACSHTFLPRSRVWWVLITLHVRVSCNGNRNLNYLTLFFIWLSGRWCESCDWYFLSKKVRNILDYVQSSKTFLCIFMLSPPKWASLFDTFIYQWLSCKIHQ